MQSDFDYSLDFENIDFRKSPELYSVGRGEQGVLLVEPYKSELLPHWRFRTPEIARRSAQEIYERFLAYRDEEDFVGMDMARKFLQMGYTRARRYANHSSGRKYEPDGSGEVREQEPDAADNEKAKAARIFYEKYVLARDDPHYVECRKEWVRRENERSGVQ
ncbi:MAG: DUF4385 domain-containing protein [Rubrobacter sp.]|nr:DUF4385 domain-containing protein [Rubrobacter sp.]